jgi:plasmid replication initiation protein
MSLLPERHPVRDFFVLDVLDVAPRSDMASMAHPIFSLSTQPEKRILRYEHDGVIVEVHPSSKGLATIYDKDILIYCTSKLMHMRNQGQKIGPTVRITTHDLLVSTNRRTGGIMYERLEDALDRLAGTRVKTNIETGDEKSTQNFGLIEMYDYNRKGSGMAERLRYLDIKLSDWLFRAIEAAEVLPISRDYFRIRRPLDRRIYEIGRKHCGAQAQWRISLDKLQKKCGSKQARKYFAEHMRQTVADNHLPDYRLELENDFVTFYRREAEAPKQVAAPPLPPPSQAAPKPETSAKPTAIFVSSSALERLKELLPRADVHHCESVYCKWAIDQEPARNEDARFLTWAQNYWKRTNPYG